MEIKGREEERVGDGGWLRKVGVGKDLEGVVKWVEEGG